MTKAELIDAVARSAKISKHAAGEAVDATFESIAKAIKKEQAVSGSGLRHLYCAFTQSPQR